MHLLHNDNIIVYTLTDHYATVHVPSIQLDSSKCFHDILGECGALWGEHSELQFVLYRQLNIRVKL